MPPEVEALEVRSLNHWTARKVPGHYFLNEKQSEVLISCKERFHHLLAHTPSA